MSLGNTPGISEPNEVIETFHNFFDVMDVLDEIENKSMVEHYCRNCKTETKQHEMIVDRNPENPDVLAKRLFCKECKIISYYYSDGINSW